MTDLRWDRTTPVAVLVFLLAIGLSIPVLSTPAQAVIFGMPGAPTPAFSLRGSISIGYSDRQLDGKSTDGQPFLDNLRRFMVIGRLSMLPADWLEFGATLGGADARRPLTGFKGELGIGAGGFVRFHPLLQEDFGINVSFGGGASFFRNDGNIAGPAPDTRLATTMKERQYHTEILLSRSFRAWNIYGGPTWHRADLRQADVPQTEPQLAKVKGRNQFGMVVGVDYYVTPLVFFNMEAQNFHEDAIIGGIGILIAPHRDGG